MRTIPPSHTNEYKNVHKKFRKTRKYYCQDCGLPYSKACVVNGTAYKGLSLHLINQETTTIEEPAFITLCEKCHRNAHSIDGKLNYKSVNPELALKHRKIVNDE